mmetsp:Transcript_115932/g.368675  ORF Transcript_115932/g.368675 Transcript_115932/m.368675 type:complete len:111 (-) Transcript_115932:1782-2114(-)
MAGAELSECAKRRKRVPYLHSRCQKSHCKECVDHLYKSSWLCCTHPQRLLHGQQLPTHSLPKLGSNTALHSSRAYQQQAAGKRTASGGIGMHLSSEDVAKHLEVDVKSTF